VSVTTLLSAVKAPRFLVSVWLWRAVAYTATTALASGLLWLVLAVPLAPLALAVAIVRTSQAGAAVLGLVGVGSLAVVGPRLAVVVAAVERRRLRLVDDGDAPPFSAAGRRGSGLYTDPHTWRAVAYLLVLGVIVPLWLGVLSLIALIVLSTPISVNYRLDHAGSGSAVERIVLGIALVPALPYLIAAFGGAHAALTRLLLCSEPDPSAAELVEVARSRARLVDAFDAERLRIERDLHDVAQQRLVSLTMQLGLARFELPADSPAAASVASAHEQAKTLMVELRDLVRGISPRTLRELGLQAAVEELAAGSSIRVTIDAHPGRFPPSVERVAYAAVSEALANVVKHSVATVAAVTVRRSGDLLTVEVCDDGRGGADPSGGSGLTGLADRAAAAGGRLLLSSPAGGPTILRVELPCAS